MSRRSLRALALLPVAGLLAACGSSGGASARPGPRSRSRSSASSARCSGRPRPSAGTASVTSLTAAAPHDLELTPQQVAAVTDARLRVLVAEFQPALDDAIAQNPEAAVERARRASTRSRRSMPARSTRTRRPATTRACGSTPRTWRRSCATVAQRLSSLDPAAPLDAAPTTPGPAGSPHRARRAVDHRHSNLHEPRPRRLARGVRLPRQALQLGRRYSGLAPDAEPSPAKIAEVADFVRANDVSTVYYETLVDPKVAAPTPWPTETAASRGAGPARGSRRGRRAAHQRDGEDLQTVKDGQPCS